MSPSLPASAPAAGANAELSLAHLVRRPVVAPPAGARAPVLVLLHGLGGTEHALFALRHHVAPEFLVVSARGPVAVGGAPDGFTGKPFGLRARGWFHVHETPAGRVPNAAEARAAWAMIPRFAREVVDAYDGDPARVLLAGFSQGAMTALAALLTAPEAFAGAAVMSGRLLAAVVPSIASPERLAGRAVLVVHGTQDPRVPVEEARAARAHLGALPLALAYEEFSMRHAISEASRRRVAAWAAAVAGVPDREARTVAAAAHPGAALPPTFHQ